MQYQNELRKIKSLVSPDTWELLKSTNAIIAGGAVTSAFCNKDVNDIDVYFRSPLEFLAFVYQLYQGDYAFCLICNHATDRSILFKDKKTGQDVQAIIYKFFPNELAIFNDYDFTCNMGALSFGWKKKGYPEDEQFVLHSDFMRHNSQRYLSFNEGTAFPLISALRVAKYVEKGYNISKAQMLRVLLAVNSIEIDNWEDLKSHCGGMYGLNMDEVFPVDQEFSMQAALESLESVFNDNKFYDKPMHLEFKDIYKKVRHYFEEVTPQVKKESCEGRLFKNVVKLLDGRLVSNYSQNFEYKVGEVVNGGNRGIWYHQGSNVLVGTYSSTNLGERMIIELQPEFPPKTVDDEFDSFTEPTIKGDVFVKAAYTKVEFLEKFDCMLDSDVPDEVITKIEELIYPED